VYFRSDKIVKFYVFVCLFVCLLYSIENAKPIDDWNLVLMAAIDRLAPASTANPKARRRNKHQHSTNKQNKHQTWQHTIHTYTQKTLTNACVRRHVYLEQTFAILLRRQHALRVAIVADDAIDRILRFRSPNTHLTR
jgi:hypothetical protein